MKLGTTTTKGELEAAARLYQSLADARDAAKLQGLCVHAKTGAQVCYPVGAVRSLYARSVANATQKQVSHIELWMRRFNVRPNRYR